jgi:hypothetical protein
LDQIQALFYLLEDKLKRQPNVGKRKTEEIQQPTHSDLTASADGRDGEVKIPVPTGNRTPVIQTVATCVCFLEFGNKMTMPA